MDGLLQWLCEALLASVHSPTVLIATRLSSAPSDVVQYDVPQRVRVGAVVGSSKGDRLK